MPPLPTPRISEHSRPVCYTDPRGREVKALLVGERSRGVFDLAYYVGDVVMPAYAVRPGPKGKPGTFREQDPPGGGCDDHEPGETTADAAHAAVDVDA